MRVEFMGLPASGKTSLIGATMERFRAAGEPAVYLRGTANKRIEKARSNNHFLKNRQERADLFGCLQYRLKHPEIFDYLMANQAELPQLTLWAMDLMSCLYFAQPTVRKGEIVLCDEGLAHRGAATSVGRDDPEGFERYNRILPDDFLLVHVTVPIRCVVRRSRETRDQLPCSRWYGDRDPIDVLKEKQRLMKIACSIRRDRGLPVVEVDGRAPLEENAERLMADILDLAGRQKAAGNADATEDRGRQSGAAA